MKYAWDVFKATSRYGLHKRGLLCDKRYDMQSGAKYTYKHNRFSSHEQIIQHINTADKPAESLCVLDVGCGAGLLAKRVKEGGHYVVGMDVYDNDHAKKTCDKFMVVDAEDGLGQAENRAFDRIVFADILEHVRNPEDLLLEAEEKLKHGGRIVASTGNVAHIFIRLMLMLGRFDYTERGILDRTHVRLFTTRSFKQLFDECSYKIVKVSYCPIPFENIVPGYPKFTDMLSWVNMLFVRLRPSLFAYQIIIEAEPREDDPSHLLREKQISADYISVKQSHVADL